MTLASTPIARQFSSFDITSHGFWSQSFDERDRTFAQLWAADERHGVKRLPSVVR